MERLKLHNECLQVEVDLLGAELKRIHRGDGSDVLWPGDQEPWQGSSPWLFPFVGRLKDDCFIHNGVRYNMPMHGFARKKNFTPVEHTATRLVLELGADETTRACYPFDFTLRITYKLDGAQVKVCAEVMNQGGSEMLFSLGGHPGLCAAEGDVLIFEAEENAPLHRLSAQEHLLQSACDSFRGTELKVSTALFREDAIILHAPCSRCVTLHRQGGERVSVRYDDVTWLGIWSRASDPLRYVCIEPWLGVDSPETLDSHELKDKMDILTLKAGETFAFRMTIEDHTAL